MASITIRKLNDDLKKRLRKQAAENGRSLEAEAREILNSALKQKQPNRETGADLFNRIQERFKPFGGVELQLPSRRGSRSRIPDFTRDDLGWSKKK